MAISNLIVPFSALGVELLVSQVLLERTFIERKYRHDHMLSDSFMIAISKVNHHVTAY